MKETPDGRRDGLDLGEQLRARRRWMRFASAPAPKRAAFIISSSPSRSSRLRHWRPIGTRRRRKWIRFSRRLFRLWSGSNVTLTLCMIDWRSCKKMRLYARLPFIKCRQRSQHTGPNRAGDRRSNHGSQSELFYFSGARRRGPGANRGTGSRSESRALFACYQGTMAQARIQNDVALLRDLNTSRWMFWASKVLRPFRHNLFF